MSTGTIETLLMAFIAGVGLSLFAEWVRRRAGLAPSNIIAVLTMVAVVFAYSRDESGEIAPVLGLFGSGYALISWHARRPHPERLR